MKKLAMIACLCAGYVYGMEPLHENGSSASSNINMCDIENIENAENIDRSIKIDIGNPDLIGQWQNIADTSTNEVSEDNVFDTSASTYKEGRFWTVVRKVFQPVQITTSAATMVLITASKVVETGYPSLSTALSYGALGSAMASGVLSLFISKMNSKINNLNRIYKAKLAEEKIVVDTRNV